MCEGIYHVFLLSVYLHTKLQVISCLRSELSMKERVMKKENLDNKTYVVPATSCLRQYLSQLSFPRYKCMFLTVLDSPICATDIFLQIFMYLQFARYGLQNLTRVRRLNVQNKEFLGIAYVVQCTEKCMLLNEIKYSVCVFLSLCNLQVSHSIIRLWCQYSTTYITYIIKHRHI